LKVKTDNIAAGPTGNDVDLRNNSTVFEELEVSIVDLTVANAVLLATHDSI